MIELRNMELLVLPVVHDGVINSSIFDHYSTYYTKVAEDISLKFQDQQVELQNLCHINYGFTSIISVSKLSLLCNLWCRTG